MTPVNELNFLGLYINFKLKWTLTILCYWQANFACCGHNKKMQHVFPKSVLITIYNARFNIAPH